MWLKTLVLSMAFTGLAHAGVDADLGCKGAKSGIEHAFCLATLGDGGECSKVDAPFQPWCKTLAAQTDKCTGLDGPALAGCKAVANGKSGFSACDRAGNATAEAVCKTLIERKKKYCGGADSAMRATCVKMGTGAEFAAGAEDRLIERAVASIEPEALILKKGWHPVLEQSGVAGYAMFYYAVQSDRDLGTVEFAAREIDDPTVKALMVEYGKGGSDAAGSMGKILGDILQLSTDALQRWEAALPRDSAARKTILANIDDILG